MAVCCPKCENGALHFEGYDRDDAYVVLDVECDSCNFKGYATFELTGYEDKKGKKYTYPSSVLKGITGENKIKYDIEFTAKIKTSIDWYGDYNKKEILKEAEMDTLKDLDYKHIDKQIKEKKE